jgi:glyoxylase-like metal-dependent hydrolase (beta-lactamase superfamily II)
LLEEVTCNPSTIVDRPEETSTDRILSACRNSLELIENLPVKRVLPGHGLPFSDHRKRIRMIREHHEKRRKEILRLLEQLSSSRGEREGVTSYVLAQRLFPSMVGIEYFYRCCAIRVHLDALEQEGLVERQNESAPLAYGLR